MPRLLPRAIAWAEDRAAKAAAVGTPLSPSELEMARAVGVAEPERVHVEIVGERLPMPDDADLHAAAVQAGLMGPGMVGLTLGYAILICRGHKTRRLLSHELRHVHQYEQHGSIAGFLPIYLAQVIEVGYSDAPLERDAREHELRDA